MNVKEIAAGVRGVTKFKKLINQQICNSWIF